MSSLRLKSLKNMQLEDKVRTVMKIDLDDIIPDPSQPRKEFDPEKVAEMSNNLIKRGQLAPILVRDNPEGNPPFMVFDGEYRWRSAMLKRQPAQLDAVVYYGDVDPDEILEGQFLINELRTDMSFGDRANFFKGRVERYGSVEAVAEHMEMNPRRIWRVLQAANAEGVAGQARDLGLSKDAETLNAIESLERQNPDAAAEILKAGQASGRITRKEVTDAGRAVRSQGDAGQDGGQGQGRSKSTPAPTAAKNPAAAPAPAAGPEANKAPHSDDTTSPRIHVRWDGSRDKRDAELKKRWKAALGEGGQPTFLSFTKRPSAGHAWVCFGSGSVTAEFPLAGLRLERIVVTE